MEYILLALGIVLLIKGADFLVEGASSLAKRFGMSTLIIGLTIVAFGTSMPELVVSILAVLSGTADTAFGNVIGSNLANTLLILGVAASIYPLAIQRSTIWKEIPFAFLAVLVLLVVSNDLLIDNIAISSLTRVDGLILLCFFAIFIYYVIELARTQRSQIESKRLKIQRHTLKGSAVYIFTGIAGLYLGGRWVVDSAVSIASSLGISDFLIAATVIALGTSLPELVTAIRAAQRKDTDMAVGGIVGSNIFNIFWILGATAVIGPISIPAAINFDILYLLIATLLFFVFMFIGERHKLTRGQGLLFLSLYVLYILIIAFRG